MTFLAFNIIDLLQIFILALAIYFVVDLFWGTRSFQIILGFVAPLAILIFLARVFKMDVISWLLSRISLYLAFAVIVIFQQEIRQVLAYIGRVRKTLEWNKESSASQLGQLAEAIEELARHKHGALIAFEREINLNGYHQNGTLLNAPLVAPLLTSIFYPNSPLHDGGVIIRDDTVIAARCIFPLHTDGSSANYGMRHRAALGLSEETDAIVIVVSEEHGTISLAFQGRLLQNITPTRLVRYLEALAPREGLKEAWRKVLAYVKVEEKKASSDSLNHKKSKGGRVAK